jgi:tetratricopeptide (TPR) repeat protein
MRLLIGLAELALTAGAYDQALRYVEAGIKAAQVTSSRKYVALGWALRGKIAAQLQDAETAGTALQRAFALAGEVQSPSLIYPIASDLGYWYESIGKEGEATALYRKALAAVEHMAATVEEEALRSPFLQLALVQEMYARAARLCG